MIIRNMAKTLEDIMKIEKQGAEGGIIYRPLFIRGSELSSAWSEANDGKVGVAEAMSLLKEVRPHGALAFSPGVLATFAVPLNLCCYVPPLPVTDGRYWPIILRWSGM